MGMVFEAGPAEATQRFVLLAIADNCDDSGFAFPGVELLAAKSCQTERNVLRILQALEVDGWLAIKRRSWGIKKRGNSYQMNLARLKKSVSGRATQTSGDKMSLHESGEADSIGAAEPSGDKLSCEQPAVQIASRGDIRPVHQVTNSSSRGDKSSIPIRKNHQEPSERTLTPLPPQAGAALAKVKRECGISNPRLERVLGDAMTAELDRADAPEGGWGEGDFAVVADRMVQAHRMLAKVGGNGLLFRRPKVREFFGEGLWRDDGLWPWNEVALRESKRL